MSQHYNGKREPIKPARPEPRVITLKELDPDTRRLVMLFAEAAARQQAREREEGGK